MIIEVAETQNTCDTASKGSSRKRRTGSKSTPRATPERKETKQDLLIRILKRKNGATIAQIVEATGWQPHTARGAIAGALKKKLGLTIVSEKAEGFERVYRIES